MCIRDRFPFASGEIAAVAKDGGERAWGAAVAGKRLGRAYAVVGDITGCLLYTSRCV